MERDGPHSPLDDPLEDRQTPLSGPGVKQVKGRPVETDDHYLGSEARHHVGLLSQTSSLMLSFPASNLPFI